jgi:bifunctional NMN adenylyltransferase/nudix hydrolase
MSKQYELVVFICRCQPLHNAHLRTIQNALKKSERVVVILGSANQPRSVKNPFTVNERAEMIRLAVEVHEFPRINIEFVEDNLYNDSVWATSIQDIVRQIARSHGYNKIGIAGYVKDDSSYYLKMFPQWDFIEQPLYEPLNATDIREMFLSPNVNFNYFTGVLPDVVIRFLKMFKEDNPAYWNLLSEKEFIDSYKKQYDQFPYPPIFVTTDAVVIQSGHVLMIQRRAAPGKGLWALPGGFVNAYTDKSIEDAMIRELYEETSLKVPEKVVRGSIKATKVFDAIGRSSRGRTITHASLILFNDGEWKLPKIQASDDAADAKWIPISELKGTEIFDDHHEIIKTMIGMI